MSTAVGEGVHRLGTEWVNWYVLDDGGITVVDSGFPAYFDQLAPALQALGRTVADVDAVVLTHWHSDHMGAAERIRRESGAVVYGPATEARGLRGEEKIPVPKGIAANVWRPQMLRYMLHAMRSGGLAKPTPIAELRTYEDGDVLDVPGRLRVIATPGHSRGHCSLVHDGRGVLFAGDALATLSFASAHRKPQLPMVNEDAAQARESLPRLAQADAGLIVCGHGDPFHGTPRAAVEQALDGGSA